MPLLDSHSHFPDFHTVNVVNTDLEKGNELNPDQTQPRNKLTQSGNGSTPTSHRSLRSNHLKTQKIKIPIYLQIFHTHYFWWFFWFMNKVEFFFISFHQRN